MLSLISTIAWHPSGHLIRTKSSAFSIVRCVNSPAPGYGGSCFVCRGNMTTPSVAERPRLGMDFIETVSALMNATPGRDLCWILTRHPEKPEYHVVLCVRQEYFDGPELDRLILDARSNVLGFASPGEAAPYQKQITRDVVLDRRSPDCEALFQDLIWAFSDFARDRRGVRDPEARYLAGNPWYPVAGQL